eukprot:4777749-Alexandrium_andersonii.AAC.1
MLSRSSPQALRSPGEDPLHLTHALRKDASASEVVKAGKPGSPGPDCARRYLDSSLQGALEPC